MLSYLQSFHDIVYGTVELPPYCYLIIDTPEFQRLRHIKQLGPASFVYPCAVQSRFDHSLGVCHSARELLNKLRLQENNNMTHTDARCVEIASLCRDLGHGPLSLTFQDFLADLQKTWRPEEQSARILRYLIRKNKLKWKLETFGIAEKEVDIICELIRGNFSEKNGEELIPPEKFYLRQIVNNSINGVDVFKWNDVTRDSNLLGITSAFQVERVLSVVKACDVDSKGGGKRRELCFRDKVSNELSHVFITNRRLHSAAYHHEVTTAVSIMYRCAFRAAAKHIEFTSEHGKFDLFNCIGDEEAFCQATDDIIRDIMRSTSTKKGMKKAKEIISRIYSRQLYQCIKEIPQAKDRIPADVPQQWEDVTLRLYTSVMDLDVKEAQDYFERYLLAKIEK
ncbi:deoxynucleoside triphosphate triphosphohydrolase SAMHD1-like [Diadema setosum]|uniref:deoxynucleoside triphosphate triphosphohydrolase SAMHD1-like n=1 Tax=Diadema setosum TaxID=31175 RepID=UPI003B3A5F02